MRPERDRRLAPDVLQYFAEGLRFVGGHVLTHWMPRQNDLVQGVTQRLDYVSATEYIREDK